MEVQDLVEGGTCHGKTTGKDHVEGEAPAEVERVKKPTWGVARKSLFYNELAVFRVSKTSTLKTAYYLIANDLRTTPNVSNARLPVGANKHQNSPWRVKNSTPRHRKGVGTRKKVTWKTSITSAKWRAYPSLPGSRRRCRASW